MRTLRLIQGRRSAARAGQWVRAKIALKRAYVRDELTPGELAERVRTAHVAETLNLNALDEALAGLIPS